MGNNLTNNGSVLLERGCNWVSDAKDNTTRRWRSYSVARGRVDREQNQLSFDDAQNEADVAKLKSAMKRTSQPVTSLQRVNSLRVATAASESGGRGHSPSNSARVTFAPSLCPAKMRLQFAKGKDENSPSPSTARSIPNAAKKNSDGESNFYKEFDIHFKKAEDYNVSYVRQGSLSFLKSNDEPSTTTHPHTSLPQENASFEEGDNDSCPSKDPKRKPSEPNFNRKRAGSTPQAETELCHSFSTGELRNQQLYQRRQSNALLANRMSLRRKKLDNPQLTGPQIHLIRQAWNQLSTTKGPTVLGSSLLQRVFFKAPSIKDSFLKSPLPQHYVNHDKLLKEHAKLVTNLIDTLVKNSENLDSMSEMLEDIGRHHAHLFEYGFNPKFWNIFAEALIDCTLEWGEKSKRGEETWKAWALIASFMIEKIKLGYIEQRRSIASPTLSPPPANTRSSSIST